MKHVITVGQLSGGRWNVVCSCGFSTQALNHTDGKRVGAWHIKNPRWLRKTL